MWVIVALCCALPLGWMAVQLFRQPAGVRDLLPSAFYVRLLARTLAYSVAVAAIATALAIPAALVLGRGARGRFTAVLWMLLPAALLMPSITYAYGWAQLLRLLDVTPEWGGRLDVARCVWTLATWLWPIPAGVLALALRRADPDVQQQAMLDGALGRLTARQLAGPAAAAAACVVALASQEFAVYEPTGISVVATEVRMVFETGAFSGVDNPITATFISGGGAAASPDASDAPGRADTTAPPPPPPTQVQGFQSLGLIDQDGRAGAAVATSLPLLLVVAVLGVLGILGVRRVSAAGDELHDGAVPRSLDPGAWVKTLAVFILILTLVVPAGAMLASLHVHRGLVTIWRQFSPQATGSIVLALSAGIVAAIVAFLAAVRPARGTLVLSLAAFLIGGQLLAIGLIRIYNRPAPGGLGRLLPGGQDLFDLIYNGIPIVVMAYLARFGWLALLAAGFTRTRPWRQVRELLALDGASPVQSALHVIWPLAWPVLAASAVLVGVLSLTEVPATVLISPLRPQPLVPMLMGWVHMLRYDDMIEGSLLLMAMALALSVVAAALIGMGLRVFREGRGQKAEGRTKTVAFFCLLPSALCLCSGCGDSTQPDEIWLETGTAPGQVVYPRAITYSKQDDTYFVVDRLARVQHLDARGQPLGGWRMPDWRVGKPVGLSVGPDGNVYVPDTHYYRVVVYTPQGQEIRRWGSRGTDDGQFIWPTDVAFDNAGNVYVSEYGDNDRIQVFSPDGTFLRKWGHFGIGDGELSRPQSLVIDGDLVYVSDACNHRIGVFKTDGTFVRNMGTVGSELGQFRFPYGLDMDSDGHLVVCEFGNSRVQLIDKDTGRGLATWGVPGRDPGQLAYPWAVALDRTGRVVTVDSGIIDCRCSSRQGLAMAGISFFTQHSALSTQHFLSLPLALSWPLEMEYIRGWLVCVMFLVGAAPIVLMGMWSLSGLGPVRKWVAIGVRLTVLLLALMILAGVRWTREHKDLEVMVLRDISESTNQVKSFPKTDKTLQAALDNYFNALSADPKKEPGDRIGVLSFHQDALIDALPGTKLALDARAIREAGNGTDPASAIQLALAAMSKDAMHRLLLVWDGNLTTGNLEDALATAAAQHVQIDVMPLRYDVSNEVLMDRFIAPTWKRENEPFSLEIILRSTNTAPVTGKLTVLHQGEPMDLDPTTPVRETSREVTLKPGLNRQQIRVPGNLAGGVHQFRSIWEGDNSVTVAGSRQGDTLSVNNVADAFTFVQGKGQVLYVDAVRGGEGAGDILPEALKKEGIDLVPITVDQFPNSLVQLTQYDAVILANVSRAALGEQKQEMLAAYVHDQGGGLLMVGGEETFGAGGWEGSKLEEVLPVDMDIPAQRQVGKGALALVMHACEMPDGIGNFYGMQCALKAAEALSEHDEVAVVTFGGMGGGSIFDYPLSEKGDGTRVNTAIKRMVMGDMPSFDESMTLAIRGSATQKGLKDSNARHRHIIVISDGDPQQPNQGLIDECKRLKISISTVTVYPHMGAPLNPGVAPDPNGEADNPNLPPTMKLMARQTGGRAYGPVDTNPNQFPQIFIKEATVVRRSLIHEADSGIPLTMLDQSDDFVKGMTAAEPLFGMVLTSKKNDPKVMMPIAAQTNKEGILDPVLAHWQAGLGRAAVFTGDAHNKWSARWVASPQFSKFWAQVVRGVARPPMSTDFDITTTQSGDNGKIVVEAIDKDDRFLNFLNIAGTVLGPDNKEVPLRLVQTAPGRYEQEFDTPVPGNYVVGLAYANREGKQGLLRSGVAMNASPELRDLKSNEARLREVALRTGGRVIERPFDVASAELFRREGLTKTASPLPVWDWLVPFLLGLIIVDVAVRRIAWDWHSTKRMLASGAAYVRSYTTTRQVETRSTVDALAGVKQKAAEQSFKPGEAAAPAGGAAAGAPKPPAAKPDPKAKFQAKGTAVEGDITSVMGGATNKAIPPPPKDVQPKGMPAGAGDHLGGLMAAKRRAQQQIKDKEQGEGK